MILLTFFIFPVFAEESTDFLAESGCDALVTYPTLLKEIQNNDFELSSCIENLAKKAKKAKKAKEMKGNDWILPLKKVRCRLKTLKGEARDTLSNDTQKEVLLKQYKADRKALKRILRSQQEENWQNWLNEKTQNLQECEKHWNAKIAEVAGKFYALVIGIAEYNNAWSEKNEAGWKTLDTPINDATAITKLLEENYGFIVKKLIGEKATQDNIIQTFKDLNKKLGENDNLLIFYAGHGISLRNKKTKLDTGYWLPVDAEPNPSEDEEEPNISNWISGQKIFELIEKSKAKNVLVIADNCEAGMFLQTACGTIQEQSDEVTELERLSTELSPRFQSLLKKYVTPSRLVITSSGTENAKDAFDGEKHSIFAKPLIGSLKKGQNLTAFDLYGDIFNEVVRKASQRPRYVPLISDLKGEGDFVFFKHSEQLASGEQEEDSTLRKALFQQQKQQAQEEIEKRCREKSLRLTKLAQQEIGQNYFTEGLLFALKALSTSSLKSEEEELDAKAALYEAFLEHRNYAILKTDKSIKKYDFSNDGKHIITITGDKNTAQLWDVNTGKTPEPLLEQDIGKYTDFSRHHIFGKSTEDDDTVQTASSKQYPALKQIRQQLREQSVQNFNKLKITFSPNKKNALLWNTGKQSQFCYDEKSEGKEETAQFWWNGEKLAKFPISYRRYYRAIFRPDGKYLFAVSKLCSKSLIDDDESYSFRLWNIEGEKMELIAFFNRLPSTSVFGEAIFIFEPDGRFIVNSGANNSKLHLGHVKSGKERLFMLPLEDAKGKMQDNAITNSHDGKKVAAAFVDGVIRVWDVSTRKKSISPQKTYHSITKMAFSDDTQSLIIAHNNAIEILDIKTSVNKTIFKEPYKDIRFSPNGQHALILLESNEVVILNIHSEERQKLISLSRDEIPLPSIPDDEIRLPSIPFSHDGQYVIAISSLWNANTGKFIRRFGDGDRYSDMIISPNGEFVATTLSPNKPSTIIWDAKEGKLLKTSNPDYGQPIAFNFDGQYLLYPSKDSSGEWLHVKTGKKLVEVPIPKLISSKFEQNEQFMLMVDEDGIYIWPLFFNTKSLIDYVKKNVHITISEEIIQALIQKSDNREKTPIIEVLQKWEIGKLTSRQKQEIRNIVSEDMQTNQACSPDISHQQSQKWRSGKLTPEQENEIIFQVMEKQHSDIKELEEKSEKWVKLNADNLPENEVISQVFYKVQKGDALSKIANKHNVNASDLCTWNKIENCNRIYPGQELRVVPE
ncbi:caspase family protein [Candidatus Marithioploca araucensis]|uniref:Caspase family protein n=1 Tax=Candidatus Marithioploca araucensis TaxID=70273 RepID=A0ABT7VQP3_9GAMM|nr:caspase family protein [Candidatus Marithioploca araucensis]